MPDNSSEDASSPTATARIGPLVWVMFIALGVTGLSLVHIAIAWWRAFGGWASHQTSPGMYGPSLPGWLLTLIANVLVALPPISALSLGWILVRLAHIMKPTSDGGRLAARVTTGMAAAWTVLFVAMCLWPLGKFPTQLRWPF